MSLLEFYIEKNKDKDWFKKYFSSGKGAYAKMFEYTSTNFRSQKSFVQQFKTFLEIENKPRDQWPKNNKDEQEKHKQHVVNMIQSKLFKKDSNEIYSRTAKGLLYTDFINLNIATKEEWLINYTFLLNGYFSNQKNYIIHRVKEDLLNFFLSKDGVTEDKVIEYASNLLSIENLKLKDALRQNFFWLHSFYADPEFFTNYLRSSEEEKEELALYVEKNIKDKSFRCCISSKYKNGSTFNINSLIDETKVFLTTFLLFKRKNQNSSDIYKIFIDNFVQNIENLDKKVVGDFLYKNKEVFDPIFEEILELDFSSDKEDSTLIEKIQISQIDISDTPEEYIDETVEIGRQKIKGIFSLKKKHAKLLSKFTCALEAINNCKPIYFTSKVGNKNYLEVHHFIPQEFRNDFPYSIEVLANYVTLCPRCHRQIHLAIDRERKHLINALYEERNLRLQSVGLKRDLNEIYQYYKIDF